MLVLYFCHLFNSSALDQINILIFFTTFDFEIYRSSLFTHILFYALLTEPKFKQGSNTDNNEKENPNIKTQQNKTMHDTNKQPLSHCDQRHPGDSILRDALISVPTLNA